MAPSDISAPAPHRFADGSIGADRAILLLFGATMFVGAGLLFWIQPMFAKMVLPLLGGSPAVWNTAMVFFQASLLAGYAYAHWLAARFSPKAQLLIHGVVLLSAFLFLPVSVAQGWIPDAETIPVFWLLGLLSVSIGLPFLAVAATAPLMQRWFSHTGHPHAGDPYFLYGASNLGSILGLLGFPLVLAPMLSVREQSLAWTGGFVALAALIALSGWLAARRRAAPAKTDPAANPAAARPDWRARAGWIAYSAIPSALLLGVTGHISTDIAAAPLLWVVPLTLYLLTFVIVFARRPLIPHGVALRAFPFAVVLIASFFTWPGPTALILPLHLIVFFVIALMCHGELARRRPPVANLTEFYLLISVGGLLGGAFTAVVAPALFNSVYEYPIAIVVACALLPPARTLLFKRSDLVFALLLLVGMFGFNAAVTKWTPDEALKFTAFFAILLGLMAFSRKVRPLGFALAIAAVIASSMSVMVSNDTLTRERSFFGVYRVAEADEGKQRILIHGTTQHGGQRTTADGEVVPISYYASDGPVAEIIGATQKQTPAPSIGIVGLGAGALACYRQPGEAWRFYEIDPLVARLATDGRYFDLMPRCAADAPIVLGDARLTLARDTETRFDLLVIDAFSSDAIPMHLLTREALALYINRLNPGGAVVLHISNRYLELRPIVAALVADQGLTAHAGLKSEATRAGDETGEARIASSPSLWVAIARTPADLDRLDLSDRWTPFETTPGQRVWTDDYSNILEAIRWGGLDAE